ncbi:hypothetical protein [Paenibacillus xylanilyticus]|uniref:DUF916 domain-containing protein n=1 Tax=Paenibacillus xylanilyticus TaxID=248903 RepID=A0A7Y6C043_9BACL|nr:hypothetical protein [Paenibacillus xylanilyticus]NUU78117.1 hypothetical protein [Paenibacillus xylanilyticus]
MIKKWKKRILIASLAVLWSLLPVQAVQAKQLHLSGNTIREWNNGTQVNARVDKTGSLQISTSTQGLKKGYYSAYVYELRNRDWSRYGAMTFSIRNESDQTLPLNVVFTRADQSSVTVSDDRNVIVIPKATKEAALVHPVAGLIQLEPGFVGQIRIPFSSLMVQDKAKTTGQVKLGKITGWGISTTTTENAKLNFRVGNIKPVSQKQAAVENDLTTLQITGDERMVRPEVGESIAQYDVRSSSSKEVQNVSFRLDSPVQGATITPDGLLTLQTAVQPESLTIHAIVDGKWNLAYPVILDNSTAMNVQEKDGTKRSIPSPDQVTKVLTPSNPLMKPWVEWLIRIVVTAAGIITLAAYWLWRKGRNTPRAQKRRARRAQRRARRPFSM